MATYINPDWTGTESGTKAEPFNSVTSMRASDGWTLDESYYWKAGTQDDITAKMNPNATGISFLSYTDDADDSYVGFDRPVISFTGTDEIVLQIHTPIASGFTMKGVDLSGDGADTVTPTPTGRCLLFSSAVVTDSTDVSNSLIEDCIIRHGGAANIRVSASSIIFRNNHITDSALDNFFIFGANDITIEGNIIDLSGQTGTQADGIQVAPNSGVTGGDNIIIRDNHITNVSGVKQVVIGPGADIDSVGGVVENNTLISNAVVNMNIKGDSPVIKNNKLISTGALHKALISMVNTTCKTPTVSGNLILDNTSEITVDGWETIIFSTVSDGIITDNVIISTDPQQYLAGMRFNTLGTTGNLIHNNIIQGMDVGIKQVATSNTESNNCFYNIGFLDTSDESATPSETWTATDPVTTDPSFIDESGGNYNLQSASGCVGQGIQHWGTGPRPSGWHGEPKADVDIDIGFQSTWSPMHPKNI